VPESIDHGDDVRVFSEALLLGGRDERPEFVDIDGWSPVRILHVVEVPHTDFTEITRVILVEVCSVVVGTTRETPTTWVLPMFSYTTMTCRDVAPVFAGLGESGRHLCDKPIAYVVKARRLNLKA